MYNGIVNIKKEAGYTSFDVVAVLRGIFGQKKIGHTGTLDPQAEGVLPVCLGNATRLCDMLTEKEKEYVAELLLGVTTDTQDLTGTVLEERPLSKDLGDGDKLTGLILGFRGEIDQIPPMYSAVKVNGKKLYDLARKGIEVERKPRKVFIRELEILSVELPVIKIRVVCSKGTYIRTLCQDIGEKAGCGGCMKSLVRTRVDGFFIEDALTLSEVQKRKDEGMLAETLLPVETVFMDRPVLHIRPEWEKRIDNGNEFRAEETVENKVYPDQEWVRVISAGEFAGIYAFHQGKQCYRPVKLFR